MVRLNNKRIFQPTSFTLFPKGGVIHQSYRNISQQNKGVEQKIRYLSEIARAPHFRWIW